MTPTAELQKRLRHLASNGNGRPIDCDAFTEAADALADLERRVAWQPIETAPKDGTPILGFWPKAYQGKGGQYVIIWFDGQFVPTTMGYRGIDFTHWMHLQDPPTLPGSSGAEDGKG